MGSGPIRTEHDVLLVGIKGAVCMERLKFHHNEAVVNVLYHMQASIHLVLHLSISYALLRT